VEIALDARSVPLDDEALLKCSESLFALRSYSTRCTMTNLPRSIV
jgi:hypothetical protein